MTNFASIAATGKSIERLLTAWLADAEPVDSRTTTATLAHVDDFETAIGDAEAPALSVLLYRVAPNAVMRAAWGGVGSADGRAHLPLDLHFLLTAWAGNAEHEHLILGAALECLESTPLLSGPLLYPTAGWATGDTIQLVPDDLDSDALLRLFDSFDMPMRLSFGYVARIARIDGARGQAPPEVSTVVVGAHP